MRWARDAALTTSGMATQAFWSAFTGNQTTIGLYVASAFCVILTLIFVCIYLLLKKP